MTDRIRALANFAIENETFPPIIPVEYDPESMFLPEPMKVGTRLGEYLNGQTVAITPDERLIGKMHFDESVTSEYYHARGHKHFQELMASYYLKPQKKLTYMEWIHSGANLEYVLQNGFEGYCRDIAAAKEKWVGDKSKLDFLEGLRLTADALLHWCERCAEHSMRESAKALTLDRRHELLDLYRVCQRVPLHPATSFYEAVQCAYFVFMFLPDSPGRIDQYLYPFYERDIHAGLITREFAKELIQEYLVMVFGHQSYKNHRSGDNHFCVGGYRPDGEDGFNDLSQLILEAYVELPIWRPQISFRWTKKTPLERTVEIAKLNRKCMNVVMVNDEPRVNAYQKLGVPFADAVGYTTVGCNETQIQGKGVCNSGQNSNVGRSISLMLAEHEDECLAAETFDDFWQAYLPHLHLDLDETMEYSDKFNYKRSLDVSMIGSLLNEGCIDKATCITAGGGKYHFAGVTLDGLICVGDSLSVIKQFVYDEKRVTMRRLLDALHHNWYGYEDLRDEILRDGRFYGNDDDQPDMLVKAVVDEIFDYTKDRRTIFGGRFQFGNIVGYNPSNVYFGALLPATPDGRFDGEAFCIGMSQLDQKDHTSLSALLRSVAKVDYSNFGGPIVLNLKIDQRMADGEEKLNKLGALYHTYFTLGGMQLQPNYITTEELLRAREQPEKYKNLRVRVSGFSGFFTLLGDDLQCEIIRRTEQNA